MADEPVIDNKFEKDDDSFIEKDRKAPAREVRRQQSRQSRYPPRQQRDRSPSTDFRGPRRFQSRRKVCTFCVDKVKVIDWKDITTLRRFMNSNGSIRARRKTGTCAKHQRQLAVAIKRARHLALTPFTDEHVRLAGRG